MDALVTSWTRSGEEILLPLLVAGAIGFLLGLDREMRGISAGVRTHMLVSLSSALTMLVAVEIERSLAAAGNANGDPIRAVQGLAQVVGFMCAGVVFVYRGKPYGMTTAASLWMASALGIAAGCGLYRIAFAGVAFALIVMTLMWLLKRYYPHLYEAEEERRQ